MDQHPINVCSECMLARGCLDFGVPIKGTRKVPGKNELDVPACWRYLPEKNQEETDE